MVSLLVTLWSFIICAASEMLAIGVLSSWVILLMKSFLISDNLFERNIVTIVKIKVMSSTTVKITLGIMKRIDE